MKLHLDRDLCQGHGRCYGIAPDLFECDDEGYAVLLAEDVPAGNEPDAQLCADNCPEYAITIS